MPGTAVFLTAVQRVMPHALLHNLKHNKVLHERNVLLTRGNAERADAPTRASGSTISDLGDDFYRVLSLRSASWRTRTCRWR